MYLSIGFLRLRPPGLKTKGLSSGLYGAQEDGASTLEEKLTTGWGRTAAVTLFFFQRKWAKWHKVHENIWKSWNNVGNNPVYLAILCDLFGMSKWPFQRLSHLQLGDIKRSLWITWYSYYDIWFRYVFSSKLVDIVDVSIWKSSPNHGKNQCQRTVASFTTHLGTSWPSGATTDLKQPCLSAFGYLWMLQ